MPRETLYDQDGRRVIRHTNGDLPEILDELGEALAERFGDSVFTFAGQLARVYPAGDPLPGVRRAQGALMLHPIEAPHLVELAGRAATHERWSATRETWTACDCPRRIADCYMNRGRWPELRPLCGFVEAPLVDAAGRVIDRPGYDSDTALFLAFAKIPGYRQLAARLDQAKARGAVAYLRERFATFPFVTPADEAALLAALITGLVRRVLPAAPLFAFSAPSPGSGKSLLAESCSIVATGRRASVLSLGLDEAEAEKRLAAVLLAGDSVICLDNIERPLRGDLLCQVATQSVVRLRPLGGSAMVNVPTGSLLLATGNNLAIVGDLKRRTVLIRLDAGCERPEHRRFAGDHLASIGERRGSIINAALTVVKAYIAAGSPDLPDLPPIGGFEQWSRMVRQPLVWAGLPDPLDPAEILRAADPELETTRLLFQAWHAAFASEQVTVSRVIAEAMQPGPLSGEAVNAELREALNVVCAERIAPRRFAGWLQRHQNQIVDGLRLSRSGQDGHSKAVLWQVAPSG